MEVKGVIGVKAVCYAGVKTPLHNQAEYRL